ncbi:MAG: DUF447 family protein [Candidatus Helarchaeota archaeon]|nr:DUF447 family protein [Candidatus Helarchaeota archaeon]
MSKTEIKYGNLKVKLNWLYEAIITTCNVNLAIKEITYNAAPMGVIFPDSDHIIIRPFLTTNTYRNIQCYGCAGINFSNNISLFYKTAIKTSEISQNDFITSKKKKIPLLKDSITRFVVVTEKMEVNESENRARILFKIKEFENVDSNVEPYTRGYFAVLESIIHYTRVNILMENNPEKGKKLINNILEYDNFIKRVYPNSDLEKIMNEIVFNITNME